MALIQSRMSLLELLQLQTGHDHDHCGNNEVSHYLYIYILYKVTILEPSQIRLATE